MLFRTTGLRPGEKLYEELLLSEEGTTETSHSEIFVAKPSEINFDELLEKIRKFEDEIENREDIVQRLKDLVPTYKPEVLK